MRARSKIWCGKCCGRCSNPGSTIICREWSSASCARKSNAFHAAGPRNTLAISDSQFPPVPEQVREPERKCCETRSRDQEHRGADKAIEDHAVGRDPGGLSEIERGRKNRDRGATRFRHHLRGVGLQCVVQHVEAEP